MERKKAMKTLFKNLHLINVFTDSIEDTEILVDGSRIAGVGTEYTEADADEIKDLGGRYVCPGFIDAHMHIESTMLLPEEVTRVCLPHGTTGVVADPHEIANVCGTDGIRFMLEASAGLPLHFYFMIPSCVPATPFDESAAILGAEQLEEFYNCDSVLGLAEMMNYPGVTAHDEEVLKKLRQAEQHGKIINGHAPLLTGRALDIYAYEGIGDDHECSNMKEALEKLGKGQRILIREGTSAKNLEGLLPLLDEPYNRRCLFCTDDRHPADLLASGHIDNIIRKAVALGKDPVKAIRMATIQTAEYYGLKRTGAVAPGYCADFLILNEDLKLVEVEEVYIAGEKTAENGKTLSIGSPAVSQKLKEKVSASFHLDRITPEDFIVKPESRTCRVIKVLPEQLLTEEWITELDFEKDNGIDRDRDIIKIAVCERHNNTGNIGLGYVNGMGMKKGAIASSVSHDSHNIVVIGTNEADMAFAVERIKAIGGGCVAAENEKVLAELPLPIAGLMSDQKAETVAALNKDLRTAAASLGRAEGIEPFMNTSFASLCVIPALKMSTHGLVDVLKFRQVSLFA